MEAEMAKIKAIRVEPGMDPVAVEIEDGLSSLQSEVGGYIALVSLDERVDAYVNDEGLLDGLPFNRVLPTPYGKVPVVGNIIVVSHDNEGETTGLTDAQVSDWLQRLADAPQNPWVM
jgi:hypothetical protein